MVVGAVILVTVIPVAAIPGAVLPVILPAVVVRVRVAVPMVSTTVGSREREPVLSRLAQRRNDAAVQITVQVAATVLQQQVQRQPEAP